MQDIPNPIFLNEHWRVRSDGFHWIIERREGNPANQSTCWKAKKSHRHRDNLIGNIENLCGEIHPDSRDTLYQLPTRHP